MGANGSFLGAAPSSTNGPAAALVPDPSPAGSVRPDRPLASGPNLAPARTRRRPGMLAAGVALVATGGLGAAYLTQVVGDTVAVVAVARDVEAGAVLDRADFAVANVNTDPVLDPVPAGRLAELVGKRTAVALRAGSLLTEAAVSEQVLPLAGQSLVGVALQATQLPAEQLKAGDRIRVVDTPASQGEPPATTPPTIGGVVVSTSGPDDGDLTIVNVTVPADRAADLAARVATGRIAVILDSRER